MEIDVGDGRSGEKGNRWRGSARRDNGPSVNPLIHTPGATGGDGLPPSKC